MTDAISENRVESLGELEDKKVTVRREEAEKTIEDIEESLGGGEPSVSGVYSDPKQFRDALKRANRDRPSVLSERQKYQDARKNERTNEKGRSINADQELKIHEKMSTLVNKLALVRDLVGGEKAANRFSDTLLDTATTLSGVNRKVANILRCSSLAVVLRQRLDEIETMVTLTSLKEEVIAKNIQEELDKQEQLYLDTKNPFTREYAYFQGTEHYTQAKKDILLNYGGVLYQQGKLRQDVLQDALKTSTTYKKNKQYFFGASDAVGNDNVFLNAGSLYAWVQESDPAVVEYFKVRYRHAGDAYEDCVRHDVITYALKAYGMFCEEIHQRILTQAGYQKETISSPYDLNDTALGRDKKVYEKYQTDVLTQYARDVLKRPAERCKNLTEADRSGLQKELAKTFGSYEQALLELKECKKKAGFTEKTRQNHLTKYQDAQQRLIGAFIAKTKTHVLFEKETITTNTCSEFLEKAFKNVSVPPKTESEFYGFLQGIVALQLFDEVQAPFKNEFGKKARDTFEQTVQTMMTWQKNHAVTINHVQQYMQINAAIRSTISPVVTVKGPLERVEQYQQSYKSSNLGAYYATYSTLLGELEAQNSLFAKDGKKSDTAFTHQYEQIVTARGDQKKIDAVWEERKSETPVWYYLSGFMSTAYNGFMSGSRGVGTELGSLIQSPFVSEARLQGHDILKKQCNKFVTIPTSSGMQESLLKDKKMNITGDNVLATVGHGVGAVISLLGGAGALNTARKGASVTMSGMRYPLQLGFLQKSALFTAGFLTTSGKYFADGIAKNLPKEQGWIYALIQGGAAGILELVSPNALSGLGPMAFNKELFQESTRWIIVGHFLKELFEENAQELLQTMSEKKFNNVFNSLRKTPFDESMTRDEAKVTVLITTLTMGVVNTPNTLGLTIKSLGSGSSQQLTAPMVSSLPTEGVSVTFQTDTGITKNAIIPQAFWFYLRDAGIQSLKELTHQELGDILALLRKHNEFTETQVMAIRTVYVDAINSSVPPIVSDSTRPIQDELDDIEDVENNSESIESLMKTIMSPEVEHMNADEFGKLVDDVYIHFDKLIAANAHAFYSAYTFLIRLSHIRQGVDLKIKSDDRYVQLIERITKYVPLTEKAVEEMLLSRCVKIYHFWLRIQDENIENYKDRDTWYDELYKNENLTLAEAEFLEQADERTLDDFFDRVVETIEIEEEKISVMNEYENDDLDDDNDSIDGTDMAQSDMQVMDNTGYAETRDTPALVNMYETALLYLYIQEGETGLYNSLVLSAEGVDHTSGEDGARIIPYNQLRLYLLNDVFENNEEVGEYISETSYVTRYIDFLLSKSEVYTLDEVDEMIGVLLTEVRVEMLQNGGNNETLGLIMEKVMPLYLEILEQWRKKDHQMNDEQYMKLFLYYVYPLFGREFGELDTVFHGVYKSMLVLLERKDSIDTLGPVFIDELTSSRDSEQRRVLKEVIGDISSLYTIGQTGLVNEELGITIGMQAPLNRMAAIVLGKSRVDIFSEDAENRAKSYLTSDEVEVLAKLGFYGTPIPVNVKSFYEKPAEPVAPRFDDRGNIIISNEKKALEAVYYLVDTCKTGNSDIVTASSHSNRMGLGEYIGKSNNYTFKSNIAGIIRGYYERAGHKTKAIKTVPEEIQAILYNTDLEIFERIVSEVNPLTYELAINTLLQVENENDYTTLLGFLSEQGLFAPSIDGSALSPELQVLISLGVLN